MRHTGMRQHAGVMMFNRFFGSDHITVIEPFHDFDQNHIHQYDADQGCEKRQWQWGESQIRGEWKIGNQRPDTYHARDCRNHHT
jgi:hypothetical protein